MTDQPEFDFSDLQPPPPITEAERQALIQLEIQRQQDAYRRDNPPADSENDGGYCPVCEARLLRTFTEGIWWCEDCGTEWLNSEVLELLSDDETDDEEDMEAIP